MPLTLIVLSAIILLIDHKVRMYGNLYGRVVNLNRETVLGEGGEIPYAASKLTTPGKELIEALEQWKNACGICIRSTYDTCLSHSLGECSKRICHNVLLGYIVKKYPGLPG